MFVELRCFYISCCSQSVAALVSQSETRTKKLWLWDELACLVRIEHLKDPSFFESSFLNTCFHAGRRIQAWKYNCPRSTIEGSSQSWGFNWSWLWWFCFIWIIPRDKSFFLKHTLQVLNARHLKPPEVHRGTLSEKVGRAKMEMVEMMMMGMVLEMMVIQKSISTFKVGRASRLRAKSNINMTRSQKNLDWVKSKFASLKANIHTQVQKRFSQSLLKCCFLS